MTETTYTIHENMKKYNVLNCYKIESLLTLFRLIEQCGEYWDKFVPIATASYGNFITDKPLYIIIDSKIYNLSELCLYDIKQMIVKLIDAHDRVGVWEIEELNMKGGL